MNTLLAQFNEAEFVDYAQFIPAEVMDLLEAAAQETGLGMDIELSVRLLATIVNPGAFAVENSVKQRVLH